MAFAHNYGIVLDQQLSPLELELYAYRRGLGLGRPQHFKHLCAINWGPKSPDEFVWNAWNEQMNEVCHVHPITGQPYPNVGLSGCTSSGKSHFLAGYAIINWMCSPLDTYVYITSTSIAESKHRVWKSVAKLYWASPIAQAMGKMVDSQAKIVTIQATGKHDDTAGIFVLAGSPAKARESVSKLIGRKNARVFFIADELPELSPSILEGAFGNLMANPLFQLIAAGNFKSREDPFGEFVEPVDGWDSIDIDSTEWEAKKSYVLRFDGMKSPNILAGEDRYKGIYGSKQLSKHREMGEKSLMFWRMARSFEAPATLENAIYTESDLAASKSYSHDVIWDYGYTNIGGADPSYTNGGDRFTFWHGRLGVSNGAWILLLMKHKVLREDVTKLKERTRDYQMADQLISEMFNAGIATENLGLDITAAGGAFASIVMELLLQRDKTLKQIHRVNFGGAPTSKRVLADDPRTADQMYVDRVTELWYVGKEFMKYGQIRGINNDLSREMKARTYDTVKSSEGLKMVAESKKKMKQRLGYSPDVADGMFVMLDMARERLQFLAGGPNRGISKGNTTFLAKARQMNTIYQDMYLEELAV